MTTMIMITMITMTTVMLMPGAVFRAIWPYNGSIVDRNSTLGTLAIGSLVSENRNNLEMALMVTSRLH